MDDDLTPAEPGADLDDDATFGDEPLDDDELLDEEGLDEPPAKPGVAQFLLGLLLAVGIGAIGVVIWALIYIKAEREYPGVAVFIALAVGYVLRVVSGRATVPVRIAAALVTAVSSLAGLYVGAVAFAVHSANKQSILRGRVKFWTLLKDDFKWEPIKSILKHHNWVAYVIFAAAVVIAFLAASPPKPKKPKVSTDEDADAPLAVGDEGALPDPMDDVPDETDDEIDQSGQSAT